MSQGALKLAGGREIVLPLSKAVEISLRSLKIRFGRSLITTSGIILAIAFLMSVWSNSDIVSSLRTADKNDINLLLQQNGIETLSANAASAEAAAAMEEEKSKQAWLVGLSLLVCVVGIANAMLMSVTEALSRNRHDEVPGGAGFVHHQTLSARVDLSGCHRHRHRGHYRARP